LVVIEQIDGALEAWVRSALAPNALDVSFGVTGPAANLKAALVSIVLYDIVEDESARRADLEDVRDDDGRVVARQGAPRRFEISYLLAIVAADTVIEHSLIGALLAAGVNTDCLPKELVPQDLVDRGLSVPLHLAKARPAERDSGGVLASLVDALVAAQGWRPVLELSVNVPVLPAPITDIERPAEILDLGASSDPTGGSRPGSRGSGATGTASGSRADPLREKRWTSVRRREPGIPPTSP
jgi:hypothetical protein